MNPFHEATPLWDLSHASSFSQLPDDDFLALLQKQFPVSTDTTYPSFTDGVNPQSISQYPLPTLTPPSEDSSPSPSDLNQADSPEDSNDVGPKRKASMEDLEEEPSQKSQHTLSNDKRGASSSNSRRKSSGASGPPKDETRLLKRKEQNRAAQRAFRERKEKHVKDLEDKVAALEAKNEQAVNENENLRDLLSRLQSENVILKQSSFTFSVPKNGASSTDQSSARSFSSPTSQFTPSVSSPSSPAIVSSPSSTAPSPKPTNPIDWSSLTSFDPSMLSLLEDAPQPTATEGAMQMDFGFGESATGLASNAPYTAIASNPMFMSFASAFDSFSQPGNDLSLNHASPANSSVSNNSNNVASGSNGFNFDMSSLSPWPTPSSASHDGSSLDDLFAGWGATGTDQFTFPTESQASLSPIAHNTTMNMSTSHSNSPKNTISRSPAASSSSSSPASSASDPMFNNSPRDSSTSDSEMGHGDVNHSNSGCPKTKTEFVKHIVSQGASPFAPANPVRKSTDNVLGTMVTCSGSSFPMTQKSDKNVEVLSAWRSITQNPSFKGVDINDLCQEFTNKARCDGTKVVLEPQGVNSILENLSKKQ